MTAARHSGRDRYAAAMTLYQQGTPVARSA